MSTRIAVHVACDAPGCDAWFHQVATEPMAGRPAEWTTTPGWIAHGQLVAPPLDFCPAHHAEADVQRERIAAIAADGTTAEGGAET